MQDLLVGILESVEGLPFIGDKAKALKEKILVKVAQQKHLILLVQMTLLLQTVTKKI